MWNLTIQFKSYFSASWFTINLYHLKFLQWINASERLIDVEYNHGEHPYHCDLYALPWPKVSLHINIFQPAECPSCFETTSLNSWLPSYKSAKSESLFNSVQWVKFRPVAQGLTLSEIWSKVINLAWINH